MGAFDLKVLDDCIAFPNETTELKSRWVWTAARCPGNKSIKYAGLVAMAPFVGILNMPQRRSLDGNDAVQDWDDGVFRYAWVWDDAARLSQPTDQTQVYFLQHP